MKKADVYDRMRDAYYTDEDFKWYVNQVANTYGKTPCEVLYSPITKEYYYSLQKGGCNERHERADIQL